MNRSKEEGEDVVRRGWVVHVEKGEVVQVVLLLALLSVWSRNRGQFLERDAVQLGLDWVGFYLHFCFFLRASFGCGGGFLALLGESFLRRPILHFFLRFILYLLLGLILVFIDRVGLPHLMKYDLGLIFRPNIFCSVKGLDGL